MKMCQYTVGAGAGAYHHNNKSSAVAEMGDRLATIDRPKSDGAAVPISVGAAGSRSNTVWPEPRPTSVPSGILIHPTIWPQYTNVTGRRTGQTDSLIA